MINFYNRSYLIALFTLLLSAGRQTADATPYCTPYNGNVFASAGGVNVITNVNVPYTGLINTTTNTNSFGYYDFAFPVAPVFKQGSTYAIIATVANAGQIMGWIDYNHDSTFQNSEAVNFTISGTTATGFVTIPISSLQGNTKLRVMAAASPNILLGPCGNTTHGEAEDYTINIVGPTSCIQPNTLTSSGTTSSYNKLKWNGAPGANFEYLATTTYGQPSTGINNTNNDSVVLTGLTGSTKYYFYVRTICGTNDFSDWLLDSFTTATCNVPAISISNISATGALVSWTNGTGATTTEYIIDQSSGAPTMHGTVTTGSSISAGSLNPNTNYCVHMRSICPGNDSSAWVTQCFTTAMVSVAQLSAGIVSCYPNPVRDILSIELNEDAAIVVSDLSGREALRTETNNRKAAINMSTLANGIYLLRFTGSLQSGTVRLVKNAD